MSQIEITTGMKREELEALYIRKVERAMRLGFSEEEAREIVQESLMQTLDLQVM